MKRSNHPSDVPKNKLILIQCKICHTLLLVKRNQHYFWFVPHGEGLSTRDYNGCNHFLRKHPNHIIESHGTQNQDSSYQWLHLKTIWYGL